MEADSEVLNRYQTLRQELQTINDKISELEMDADEHRLVLAALSPLPPTRKCWRQISGILVEGNVETTLPILKTNLHGLEKTLGNLNELLKKKDAEILLLEREKVPNLK